MDLADPYKVFNLTDAMMHIDKETLPLAHQRRRARKKFIDGFTSRLLDPKTIYIIYDICIVYKNICGRVVVFGGEAKPAID